MTLSPREQLVLRIAAAPVIIALLYLGLYGRQRFAELRELQSSVSKISRPLEGVQQACRELEISVASLEREVQQLQTPFDAETIVSGKKLVGRNVGLPVGFGVGSEPPSYATACTHLIRLFLEEQLRCESSEYVSTGGTMGDGEGAEEAFKIRFVGHYSNMLAALRALDESEIAFILQNFSMHRDLHADLCDWNLTVLLEERKR